MSFAPPKQTVSPAARAPAGPARDDPISGRLARAATGVSYDKSEGVTVSPGGTRRLWLVESDRAPRSPGVATVAAVSGAPSASAAGFGARRGASGTAETEMDKGPAFSHLTRQNDQLAKRLDAAHKHLRRAFGPGRDAQYMTTALRIKTGAQALKCVAEAVPIGDALLANWDAAWGLQLRHLTRGKERAERDLERARAQTELALEEAEAAHAETEAYRMEMDANVDRIERARAVAGELKALEARAADAEARAEKHQQKLANADARAAEAGAAAVAAAEARAQAAEARAQTQAAAAADELAALRAELEKTRETMRELQETRARELEDAAAARSPRSSARVSFGTEKSPCSSARVSERVEIDPRSSRARVSAGTKETHAKNITREQERAGVAEKLALDASEARRVAERRADDAETRAAEAEARARAAEVECEAERENARLNREETRRAHDDAAAKQIELQDRVIALQNELKQCRLELEECRGALAGAAATRDVAPQVRAMQETSRKLRRELAAAERVRFAAKLVAEDTHARWRDAAVRGDDEALEETRSRDDASVVFELASRVAAMQAEMAELREKGGAVVGDAIKDGKDGKDTRRGDDDSEVSTLRRRLAEANAHVAVLASSRDKALMESARVRVADSVVARGARDAGTSARTPIVRKNSGLFGVTPVTETLRTGSESLRLEFSPTKQTTFSSNAENFPTAEARADAPAPRIEAARAEAERLVAEAENVGREAFTRLKSASAKFGTNLRAGADRKVRAAPRAKA
jgi:hypothetical protein